MKRRGLLLTAVLVLVYLLWQRYRTTPKVNMARMKVLHSGPLGTFRGLQSGYDLNQTLGENLVGIVDAFALLMAPAAVLIVFRAVIKAASHQD